ncbi:MAG: bifunctional lysylphosphatidylglycerol flippase/synthetase MprF [Acidimicrobiales bacterium]
MPTADPRERKAVSEEPLTTPDESVTTPEEPPTTPEEPPTTPDESVTIDVPLGRRVMVVGDLLLPEAGTPSSIALGRSVAATLDRWQGPGVVVVCGNLFGSTCTSTRPDGPLSARPPDRPASRRRPDSSDSPGSPDSASTPGDGGALVAERARRTVESHRELAEAIESFAAGEERRVVVVPGWRDEAIGSDAEVAKVLTDLGAEIARSVRLELSTAAGEKTVEVVSGCPMRGAAGVEDARRVGGRPWLDGIDRLEDPSSSRRFITSRLLYRRLRRFIWMPPLVLAVVAFLLRIQVVAHGLGRVVHGGGTRRAIAHAYVAGWGDRLTFLTALIVFLLVVLGVVVAVSSRGIWRALGGGSLPAPWSGGSRGLVGSSPPSASLMVGGVDALDRARSLVAAGTTGVVAGGSLRAELTHLGEGFYASPGGTTELVREHPGRLGLPPVYLHHSQSSWVELETGAELHVRLMLADVDLPSSTILERLVTSDPVVKGYKATAEFHPALVASWPRGASWPAAPDTAADRRRARRVRRLAGGALFVAGLVDLLAAVTPPLRDRLHVVEQYLPLGVAQAAGALVALAGVGLMMLARGVLHGQRRAWGISVALLTATVALHVVHGGDLDSLVLTVGVLVVLVLERERFRASADTASSKSAILTLLLGGAVATGAATIAMEVSSRVRHHPLPGWPLVLLGSAERLVGMTYIEFPGRVNGFISPSLLGVGVALVVVAVYLFTRPVVEHRLSIGRAPGTRRAAEIRARDVVRRHGTGSLDYFALRDDKQWFFHRDSLVAYGVYGGVCLVSPDPIGPNSEREHIWSAFRHFADQNGWTIGIMGAAEEWLPIYRDSGMRHVYLGDEAIVDVEKFSLDGGKMKGLRQAVNRIARYGYTAQFLDPSAVEGDVVKDLVDLMTKSRRGEEERGFSMMLGRIFDPRDTGLLLTVVYGPDETPVAMCQFVPSRAVEGYSLDLMRRDPADHPNGLLDFALCSTIEHLRAEGKRGLSLNFSAMRSTLEGENGDGITHKVERWALRRLSGVLQIESLWKFNAKYEPSWLPRYICYDSAEQLIPTAIQIMRAESLTEMPVVGRLLSPRSQRRQTSSAPTTAPTPTRPTPTSPHDDESARSSDHAKSRSSLDLSRPHRG